MAMPYELFSRYYDYEWGQYSEYCRDVVQEAERSALRPFRRICDAACGTGLLLSHLQESGRRLHGYDSSPSMIARAQRRVPAAEVLVSDLSNPIPFPGGFDLITCFHDSLNYLLHPQDLQGFFRHARRVLRSDGVLLCDVNSPELYQIQHGGVEHYLLDGDVVRQELEYLPGPPPRGVTRFCFPDGEERHIQRAYSQDEVLTMMRAAGLYVTDVFEVLDEQNGDERNAGTESGKIVYVAVRA